MRVIFSTLAFFFLAGTAAMACPGQTGKVIFEDHFADDSGGWTLGAPWREIKNNTFFLHPSAKDATVTAMDSINLTFNADDGDYCAEFILPKANADNSVSAGFYFWRKDGNNKYYVFVNTDTGFSLQRLAGGNWNQIYGEEKEPAVKMGPDTVNSLRLVAKEGKLTLFLNGTQMKVIRASKPSGELSFGLSASISKLSDTDPVVQFKSFKITTGE